MQRDLVIIIGLACSGKTTLARQAANNGHQVIHADDLRYSDSQWTRKPLVDFQADVNAAIETAKSKINDNNKFVVFESALLDINDFEDARTVVLKGLLPRAAALFVVRPDDLNTCLERIIDRCIGRATGGEPPGSCPETTHSRARLVQKFITGYPRTCAALKAFQSCALDEGCPFVVDGKIASVSPSFLHVLSKL